jgi:hypothetical protein
MKQRSDTAVWLVAVALWLLVMGWLVAGLLE